MSYGVQINFVESEFKKKASALVYCMDVAKELAMDPALSEAFIREHFPFLCHKLRMAGVDLKDPTVRRLETPEATVAIKCFLRGIFSLRFVYWGKQGLLALISDRIPENMEGKVCSIYFQNSCDPEVPIRCWSDKIPYFRRAKMRTSAILDNEKDSHKHLSVEKTLLGSVSEQEKRMYQEICEDLHIEDWVYNPQQEKNKGFYNICVNGIFSQEQEDTLTDMVIQILG